LYFIADVGSNYETTQDLIDSVYYAHKAGADAVKFQYYDHKSLYGYDGDGMRGLLTKEQLDAIRDKCRVMKTDLIITPFHESHVEILDQYVDIWKVASSDINYMRMLKKIAKTGKFAILSTGASESRDIIRALSLFDKRKVALLYCVSSYPSAEHDLTYINSLAIKFKVRVGYSDHSLDVFNTAYCCENFFGCKIFEKHFKIREFKSPDNYHSLLWDDFKRMVDRTRRQGAPTWRINKSELDMVQMHNRRLVAINDIEKGAVLQYGINYGAYRSKSRDATRISPFDESIVENRRAKRKIFKGQSIAEYDFE